jgi:hypothetical protein
MRASRHSATDVHKFVTRALAAQICCTHTQKSSPLGVDHLGNTQWQVDSTRTGDGCAKKQCIKSSEFYKEGGIQHKLKAMGAKDVLLCFTDNCNQG